MARSKNLLKKINDLHGFIQRRHTSSDFALIFMNSFEATRMLIIGRKSFSPNIKHPLTTALNSTGAIALLLDDLQHNEAAGPLQMYGQ